MHRKDKREYLYTRWAPLLCAILFQGGLGLGLDKGEHGHTVGHVSEESLGGRQGAARTLQNAGTAQMQPLHAMPTPYLITGWLKPDLPASAGSSWRAARPMTSCGTRRSWR